MIAEASLSWSLVLAVLINGDPGTIPRCETVPDAQNANEGKGGAARLDILPAGTHIRRKKNLAVTEVTARSDLNLYR
ncbi:hypothetical protein CUN67_02315 [Pantoea cypripedii]|uniref:Uncharacterized protein n=1 Tax=Pantoea cypripedii TaxID=55209 RepID=A0A6B9G6I3_PANCY|nr:hypothetical protein CUN67_02315 [Pantoea cypripedii]